MYISSLILNNFRNYESERLEFSPLTNVIYGDNAQGKTNILEAVYLFSQGRSHRAKTDRELIRFDMPAAKISVDFHDSVRDYCASMQISRGGKKQIKVNHVQITKLSMLMNYLNVVMFSPEDLELVKGSPSVRRRFIDSAISQLSPAYLINLTDYHKTLAQKNSCLKAMKIAGKKSDMMLSVWNEQLSELGVKIMKARGEFLTLLDKFAQVIQSEISSEKLKLTYMPSVRIEELTKEAYLEVLERHRRREIDFASALCGISRDDMGISINGRPARIYGSQGQQRTATLSLKMAQAEYIHYMKEEYPLLLLDDIMSELDINRRMYLSQRIRDKQVLITSTDTDLRADTGDTKLFKIQNGRVVK
ncbi:MAG: DNA replication/repair protein RecF [Clostridiales bacterium]|nr:DNA replication/repair protein RecF [Clostridiales bacterium]